MGIFDRFPYSSTHEMNLDFMLGKATEIAESLQEIDTHKEQAEQAATNAAQSATSAAQSATSAAQSATSAAEQYQSARGAAIRAEVAQGNAENAATNAGDAADRAEAASDRADEAVEQAQAAATQAQTAATNAGTAADGAIASAAAAETRINNLAASLPEDFTNLNNEVTDLKSALSDVEAFIDIRKSTGVYVKTSDGTLELDRNYNVYTCNVVGLSEVKITPYYTTNKLTYAFYKNDGTYISNSSGTFASSGENTINIPADAYTIKYSSIIYKDATIKADWGAVIATKDETAVLQKDLDEVAESTTMKVSMNATWSQMNTAGNTGHINTYGNIVSYANQYVSDFVKIDPTQNVAYNVAYIYGSTVAIAFYNKVKQYISGVTAQSGTGGSYIGITGTATPPSGAVFMRYSMSKNTQGGITKTDQYVNYTGIKTVKTAVEELMSSGGINPWIDKKWCAFGTSITDTSYINQETGEPTGKYVPFLAQYSGLQVTNRGIAGGTIGSGGIHGGSSSILNAILNSNDLDTFDLITLEGFVNDFAAAVSIGEIGDTANTTMYGALHQALSYILANSHAEIVLITETTGQEYTLSGGTTADYKILRKNSLNLYQQDYNDVIIRIGQFYGVHVIDAGGKSQINQYHPEYIIDQIHHTTLGGEQYAKTIWEELRNITPAKTSD